MLIYLLKFSACLAIFVVYYKIFLERERMHQLKRFYLLGAIFISLSFPLITFTTYVEPIVVSNVTSFESFPEMSLEQGSVEAPATNFLPIILWTIYGLGVLLFGIKFILNLSKIVYKIKRNPKHVAEDYTHVLLRDLVTPHTFFSYIFLNKQKFDAKEIPREVFIHEEAHAKQKHSIDVLLVELLQMVFWFNPLIYLTKQFIKMNHEFLADEAVIKQGIEPSNYQQLLLTFSSNVSEPQLANAINYSSIKKRFTVMKTHTSKQKIWTRSFLLLPLIALTLYGFSNTKIIEKAQIPSEDKGNFNLKNNPVLEINKEHDYSFRLNGQSTSLLNLKKDFINVTNNEKSDLDIKTTGGINMSLINRIMSELKGNLIKINLDEAAYIIGDDFNIDSEQKATTEEVAEYNKLAKHCNSQIETKSFIVKEKNVKRLEQLYTKMSVDQRNEAETYPNFSKFPPPPSPATGFINVNGETLFVVYYVPKRYYNKKGYAVDKNGKTLNGNIQVNASDVLPGQYITKVYQNDKVVAEFKDNMQKQQTVTQAEVAEYNKLAKHINSQDPNNTILKGKDVERIQYLFNKMSKEQQNNSEPFPNIVPPQPPAPAQKKQNPPTQEEIDAYNTWAKKIHSESTPYVSGNGTLLPIVDEQDLIKFSEIYNRMSLQQKNQSVEFPFSGFKSKENEHNSQLVPPPPVTKSPLDHVIEMAKKGAKFYYEGKLISSDEAIKLLKENHELNVATKESESKEPKVYISKNPIKIVTQNNSKEPILVNGKKVKENSISMTKEDLAKASFSTKDGDISSFMFKIPGVKTESITGNKLNDAAKAKLEKVQIGDAIQLFMIKDSKSAVHPPLMITIIK